ncbi:mediator of DNA damage checkpoint protein 1-like [Pectinophora gossypiella]|uniref:mediator of DNA damage checkpoint protein 1-like n=1 Tax=Pectinophora gossypiella TaxID=13191 RepID=UPI00214F2A5D|nr:mediator of DNA damage checkpoint protein 1-like [Pectinophora gossypiella]
MGARLCLVALSLQALVLTARGAKPHRRSMPTQQSLPVSKGGWRPVVGSGGLVFGFGTAPLHAPYKIPVQFDSYPSSARPLTARDATKLTSIAQSYRPTTLRTVAASPAASQPISSYLNPFSLPNNGLTHYKYVQNFPVDSVLIRNPHNPYAARPVFAKPYPTKQSYHKQFNLQQIPNLQPIQFNIPSQKPLDVFAKPVNGYAKPTDTKTAQSGNTEIYKTEVYKLQDSDSSQQQVNQQQVKTAQQSLVTPKIPVSPYPQYQYQDAVLPPGILGTFGSFGVQSVKARDPLFPTKTTFFPPQTTKQTLFNSFSFAPNFKTTPTFVSTTPKLQTTSNQIQFGSTWNDFKNVATQPPKPATPAKIDPNTNKGTFKPSPQDPFIVNKYHSDYNKVSTYNPSVQTTTFAYSNYHDYYPAQQNAQALNYYNNQQTVNSNYEKKQKIHAHDSVAAGVNQQTSQQYANPPKKTEVESVPNTVPFRATYEVTETYETDEVTNSSPQSWPASSEAYNQKTTEEVVTKPEYDTYSKPTTPLSDIPEEVAIVTEGDKGYDNSLSYDSQLESQSRRPLGDDFEPIGKHKLKEYYYRVSTPTYDSHSGRRTKKPTESSKYSVQEVTTSFNSNKENNEAEILPTLPPNKHFKRPSTPAPEPADKDRVRKRNKIRRRRPPLANGNRDKEGTTRRYQSSTEPNYSNDDVHTIRPRVRPTQSKPNLTTPTTSAVDVTTSAIPTISPTIPTIVKKKLVHRRPYTTTTEKPETTTVLNQETNKESPIMKISASSRISFPKTTPTSYDIPDYTHKQDEKDTPTSDIAVSLTDTLKTTSKTESSKTFSFHRDAKPVEAKLEPIIREVFTTESTKDVSSEVNEVTTTPRIETTSTSGKVSRPRLKNKFGRPGFSVKDYRNRLSSTTSTEKPAESPAPKIRFPNRRIPVSENKVNENENATERKKFTPKDPRHKNGSEISEETEKEIHSIRPNRQRQTTTEASDNAPTQKISARIRNGARRPKPTEEPTETSTSPVSKRPLRKKIKDSDIGESVQDVTVTDTTANYENKNDITSERTRSESAIMKIADKKHQDHLEHLFEHSKRVSDLTLAASKDYNTPGMFKTVSANSRRIPNYFTIATDDPILPIEAFFPQINQKKES